MANLLNQILKELPQQFITSVEFEAANIIIYSNSKRFLLENKDKVKELVSKFRKRIEIRSDSSILESEEEVKKIILGLISKDIKVDEFIFEKSLSKLILVVDDVSECVGQGGENIKKLQKEISWSITVTKTPLLKSKTISTMDAVLHQESEYRRKFLNKVGNRIYKSYNKERDDSWMRITFLGAGSQIGRSSIYFQTQKSRILFDCGIDPTHQVGEKDFSPHFDSPDFKIEDIDAIVLSHAHMDHCGLIPYLYKIGYKGPVYCTQPTRDLMVLSQLDFIKIMQNTQGQELLYKPEDVKEMLKHIITLNYQEVCDVTSDLRLTFYNAGHILGSCMCHLNVGNGFHNFLYSGDFNYTNRQLLLEKTHTNFTRVESFLMETTNAGKGDYSMDRDLSYEELLKIITEHYVFGGKILIPSFGIGRAQEMLLTIEKLISEERLPDDIEVYVDGMIYEVVAIHTNYPNYLNRDLRRRILGGDNPFTIKNFIQVENSKMREKVLNSTKPCIVLATSGMMNGGSSVEYFKNFCDDEKNGIIFVGYQAQGTLGRRVKDGEKKIILNNSGNEDDKINVNMKVYSMNGAFSGHSDISMNKNFLKHISVKPKTLILNHGDIRKIEYFSSVAKTILPYTKIYTPKNLDSVRLD